MYDDDVDGEEENIATLSHILYSFLASPSLDQSDKRDSRARSEHDSLSISELSSVYLTKLFH